MRYTTLMRGAQPVMAALFEYDYAADTLKDGKSAYSLQTLQVGGDHRAPLIRLPSKAFVLRAYIRYTTSQPYVRNPSDTKAQEIALEFAKNSEPIVTPKAQITIWKTNPFNTLSVQEIGLEANEVYLKAALSNDAVNEGKLQVVVQYIVRGRATQIN